MNLFSISSDKLKSSESLSDIRCFSELIQGFKNFCFVYVDTTAATLTLFSSLSFRHLFQKWLF